MTTLSCQRNKFLLRRKFAYLNCAYMSPQMKKVERAGKKAMAGKRQPNQISADDFFHNSNVIRQLYSDLINNPDPDRIVSIPSVSYGIANVVNNLPIKKGQNIVVAGDQFPSNIYPWKNFCDQQNATLKIIYAPDTVEDRGKKWNEDILAAIDDQTIAVAISHYHWADGTRFDLKAIRKKLDDLDGYLVIDGTQSIGAAPFDIQEIKPDALIVAGYKWLLGPYSTGLAYYGKKFDGGHPIEQNWINRLDSHDFANLVNYQDQYERGALRYEVGEHSNFVLKPMLIASIKQLRKWGVENIQHYCRQLTNEPIAEMRNLGLYIENDEDRSGHLFGIKFPKEKMDELSKQLKIHRVSVSTRGEFIRVAPHVYNDEKDMNKLLKSLKQAIK